ncbi:Protein CBG17491 [Caenorhabditis briggsae]|uniref:Protein CBG17491 n=1 Tax=Caenorhabditis briggsae TaxID=6238 RepID=A8XR26_CAEBR|nr:Protein CBG17491 [Caenorhabditis briggsae]CAP35099.2 Protein CBG17491 [Caenorhabditis briggsae]
MRILFILVFVSYGFSRFSRDTSDKILQLSVDRMEKIARITYGIYVQKGLTDGEISIDEIFKIKNLNQVFEDSGALENELKSLVTVSQSLRKSPDIEKNQQYFLALEAIRKKVDGLGDVEKWAESGEIQKITQSLKDKEIDLPKVESFLEYCGKLDEAFVFLTGRKNLDDAADKLLATGYFSVLKNRGNSLASEMKLLNSDHQDVKTVFGIKSVKDPLSVIFQATDASKEFNKQTKSFTVDPDARNKNFENFKDIWEYSQKSNTNIQALKSIEDLMTSSGETFNPTTFEKMFDDLNDPWVKSVIKSPEFPKSLESLKLFEASYLKKIQANLKGSRGQNIPIFDLLLNSNYNPTEAETVANEFTNCRKKLPVSKVLTADMDSLKAGSQNMEKSVDGLKSVLDGLIEISKDAEFQQMLSDVIGFAESSVGDLQSAFVKFKSYQDYGKFNQKVLKIKSLVEKIKNLKSELKIHALAVHDNVGKVVDYQNSYKSLSEGFGCLKNVKNSGNLIGMIDLARNMGKLSSSSLDPLEKYIEKIEKISPDLKKLQNDMNSLKGKGSDGLDLLKDRKTHSEVIQMATHGIGAMKTAIEKKAEIQKMVPELKLVDDLKKTSKSLDQKDLDNLDSLVMMEASLDEMYQGLESWKSSLKNPEFTNLIDHHEIFVKAKAVSGLSLDLLEIGTSLEKLIGETTDTQKKAKLEEVLKMVDEMAFVGMEFSRYSKSFDDSKKTLTALDTFFASFAKNPSGSSGSSALSTTQNSAESPDHTTLICVIALILLLIFVVGGVWVFRRCKKKKLRRKNALAPLTPNGVISVPKKPPTKSSTKSSTKPEKKLQPSLPLDNTQSDHNSSKSKKSAKKVGHKEDLSENKTQADDAWCLEHYIFQLLTSKKPRKSSFIPFAHLTHHCTSPFHWTSHLKGGGTGDFTGDFWGQSMHSTVTVYNA